MHNNYNHLSFRPKWTLTNEIHYLLGECHAVILSISNTPIRPDYKRKLLSVSLIKGAQATTAIEGNTLDIAEIEKIKNGEHLPPSREYLEIEVKNILEAFDAILQNISVDKKKQLITPELIKDFHNKVGKNLKKHFSATPGQFRKNNVIVGNYRPPNHTKVIKLINELCLWLKKEFHYEKRQTFIETIIQAIVTHVYIAWIHPFSDGNGRTARLLEFYLLLSAGVPDIAAHVLSNFYNVTRSEYYRQLDNATKKNDLSEFIFYAIRGFRDGLFEVLNLIQENQLLITWENYIFVLFENKKGPGLTQESNKRRRDLMLDIPYDKYLSENEIKILNTTIYEMYEKISDRSFTRDLDELIDLGLLEKKNNKYKANIEILTRLMAKQSKNV